ncbi:hypothetical protein [Flavobacterium panacagri]|uniref:hypothetical protein n=1 Tax=Flavobacterium panacagri TaxID=3034146 RepID=UPI0025A535CE|nr:hypothetical protein [Flavobacterium panacagri]
MKHLIYFLLFSSAVFSQNYHYAIDEAPVKTTPPVTPGVNNQQEEIDYFNAYLLPITQKATLQAALDKYGAVRLEKGDYTGVDIVMKSNQRLYGHPTLTKVSNITIAAGSTNVRLEDLLPADKFVTFQSGGVISNCTFKSIKWAILKGTNVMVENCSFINYGGHIQIDCSQSGYFRNNKIIKHQSGTVSNVLVMKGNSATPSYGNVHLHTNFLTPHGDTSDLDNLQSSTFVGIDAESWNFTGEGTKAMFFAKNMGNLKITDFGGGNGGSPFKTPSYDIDAANVFFLNKYNNYPTDVLSLRTNMFLVNGIGPYIRKAGTVTGYDLLANLEFSNAIKYNGVEQTTAMTNATTVKNLSTTIRGTQYTPWARPNWETLPDPLGANWKTERAGKADQTSYIQGLIDSKGIADLPEGIYYIKSTLKIPLDNAHGIFGKGTGKTAIVGLTDDFPLISLVGGKDGNFTLANLTLQGGSVGVYASTDYGAQNIAYQNMKFVVFRDQNYGIHLKKTGGFDNNFLENLGFVNCNIGFFQDPTAGNSGENNSAYVDKTMFYKNQYINCGTAISMLATRADNLDAWVDCKFDGGKTALTLAGQNYPIIANSDFTNFNGVNVLTSNSISMYNVNVYNNKNTGSTIVSSYTNIEGCRFLDSSPMFSPMLYTSLNNHIINSVITGDVLANVPANKGFGKESAVYSNSSLLSNPTINKLLVNVKEGVSTVIINEAPTPYPQLLVTQ